MSALLANEAPNDLVPRCIPAGPTATALPDEILREIFLCVVCDSPVAEVLDLALQGTNDWRFFGEKNAYRSTRPFILATVCRRWRYMAHDTAELWTWISLGRHPHGTLVCNPEYLEALLNRSKRAALDIYINLLSPVGGEAWVAAGEGICTSLASVRDRWRTLSLNVRFQQISLACAALLSGEAPKLEYLDLSFFEERNSEPLGDSQALPTEQRYEGPVSVALELQRIRTISLSDASLPVVRTTLPSLVSLNLCGAKLQLDMFWCILHCSPNVQILCLSSIYGIPTPDWCPRSPLRLSHLAELVLLGCESCITLLLARHVEFPRLETLYTEDVEEYELAALLPSASESLTSLGYGDNGAIYPSLLPVISTLPHVREFWFGPCDTIPDPAFFAAMEAGAFFPKLESLYLVCGYLIWEVDPDEPGARWVLQRADEAQRSAQALLSFVRSRNAPAATGGARADAPPRLEFVQVDGEIDPAFCRELEELVPVRMAG